MQIVYLMIITECIILHVLGNTLYSLLVKLDGVYSTDHKKHSTCLTRVSLICVDVNMIVQLLSLFKCKITRGTAVWLVKYLSCNGRSTDIYQRGVVIKMLIRIITFSSYFP